MDTLQFCYTLAGQSGDGFGVLPGYKVRLRGFSVSLFAASGTFTGPGTVFLNGFADANAGSGTSGVGFMNIYLLPVVGEAANLSMDFGPEGLASATTGAGLSVTYTPNGSDPSPANGFFNVWGELYPA